MCTGMVEQRGSLVSSQSNQFHKLLGSLALSVRRAKFKEFISSPSGNDRVQVKKRQPDCLGLARSQ